MQKLSPGYILTKIILFFLFNIVGVCLAIMFLQIAESSELTPSTARTVAGAIGLAVWCVLTYRVVMTAKLNKITKKDYLMGEGITALLYLVIAAAVCTAFGSAALYEGWKTVLFLPMMTFCYPLGNLYLGLAVQFVFCLVFVRVCYEIKAKKDPALLGRAKKTEQD